MTTFHDQIQQVSDEWFRIRHGKVGGTTSSQLHVKSETLLDQLLGELSEPFQFPDQGFVSDAMARGNELEPYAIAEAEAYLGMTFVKTGWMQSGECSLIGASPDAVTDDRTEIIEVKCPSAKVHISYIRGGIVPTDHVDQVVHYFAVHPELQKVHFVSYRPENIKPLFVVTVTRETELNVGTKARPVMSSVGDYAKEKVKLAKALELVLDAELEVLRGI